MVIGVAVYVAWRLLAHISSLGCGDAEVTNLATEVMYEDLAKRSFLISFAAAEGRSISEADIKAVEAAFKKAMTFKLGEVTTLGKTGPISRCKATVHITNNPSVNTDGVEYNVVGESYSDGEVISYSVRQTDDGTHFYVQIPAD